MQSPCNNFATKIVTKGKQFYVFPDHKHSTTLQIPAVCRDLGCLIRGLDWPTPQWIGLLHCTLLHYGTALYSIALHCTALHYGIALYSIAPHCTALHSTVNTALNSTALHCRVIYCSELCCTAVRCRKDCNGLGGIPGWPLMDQQINTHLTYAT